MADARLPAYVLKKRLAGGRIAYFWNRPAWADPKHAQSRSEQKRRLAVRHGKTCPVESTALGEDLAEAITRANALNEAFKEWRVGKVTKIVPGSVRWLFRWYREQEKFLKLRHKTRKGYWECMDAVEAIEMRAGVFGTRRAGAVDGPAADALYHKAKTKHGERQGSYMMQVARLIWNHASRPGYAKITGVSTNPFAGMGITASSGTGKGNRAATRGEYDRYRAAARELGYQSMATAAALSFEGCQRVWDVFGIEDPDDRVTRGVFWTNYRRGEEITLIQSKTGKLITLPLTAEVEVPEGEGEGVRRETVRLYPELEDELGRMPRTGARGEMIVRRELDGQPYPLDYLYKIHARIRKKAGLPADLRFTSFRHGGLTEIGDADVQDSRAVSGHTKVDTTLIYNKANVAKARAIAVKRREHVALITAGEADGKEES
ncbi:hypothetical protein HY78_18915 [Rhizorhabdus wittichii DC-6]|nr:hypothetical protein HY78_18915 [Rhizorhabdus wittichii DC-6]